MPGAAAALSSRGGSKLRCKVTSASPLRSSCGSRAHAHPRARAGLLRGAGRFRLRLPRRAGSSSTTQRQARGLVGGACAEAPVRGHHGCPCPPRLFGPRPPLLPPPSPPPPPAGPGQAGTSGEQQQQERSGGRARGCPLGAQGGPRWSSPCARGGRGPSRRAAHGASRAGHGLAPALALHERSGAGGEALSRRAPEAAREPAGSPPAYTPPVVLYHYTMGYAARRTPLCGPLWVLPQVRLLLMCCKMQMRLGLQRVPVRRRSSCWAAGAAPEPLQEPLLFPSPSAAAPGRVTRPSLCPDGSALCFSSRSLLRPFRCVAIIPTCLR